MSTATPAAPASTLDRDWISKEFSKGIDAERAMENDARTRMDSPPEAALGVLYGQIAEADARHRAAVETIAVRYGHVPKPHSGGITETLGHLKDKVASIGTTAQEWVAHDLATKANALHWYAAWVHTFEAIGDSESARELAAIQTEEAAQREALQQVLNRMVEKGARGGQEAAEGK